MAESKDSLKRRDPIFDNSDSSDRTSSQSDPA